MRQLKKGFMALLLASVPFALAYPDLVADETEFNQRTEWLTPNPLAAEILVENFQTWPSTRTYSIDPLQCNLNNRTTNYNWNNYRFRRFSGETEYYANVYLRNCEIQPFCDTQSGVMYSLDPANVREYGSGKENLGPSNPGVSTGNITILDSTTINGVGFNTGYIVIGQMKRVKLIQYTTSSFGARRGFKLDCSFDRGRTWITLRQEKGQRSTDSTICTSGFHLYNSSKGLIWEEEVNLSNVMLRFSKATAGPQLVRIHDLRIYGRALSEDMNDSEFETNSGVNWGDWVGVRRVNSTDGFKMWYGQDVLNFSEPAVWVKVFNLGGLQVWYEEQAQIIDLSELPKGVYLVKARNESGRVITDKVIR